MSDDLLYETTVAMELDWLRAEFAALHELVARAANVRQKAQDSKLNALKDCLTAASPNRPPFRFGWFVFMARRERV